MSALAIIVICDRLRKGIPVRLPAMRGSEFSDLLSVLAYLRVGGQ